MRILLVEDDLDLTDLLAFSLQRGGFTALSARNTPEALKLLDGERPDLAVLDINLGDGDGFTLLEELRRHSEIPVIMLTARAAEDDKVRAFESGADDYVTKPFSHRELIARIRAQLRRRGHLVLPPERTGDIIRVGPITLSSAGHSVTVAGEVINLTVTEFRLLRYLMVNAGVVMPMHAILKHVWGYEDTSGMDAARVAVYRLRRKLDGVPGASDLLQTVPGVGIILRPEPTEAIARSLA